MAAADSSLTEALLRRESWLIGAGLAGLCLLSWLLLLKGAGTGMSPVAMTTWAFPPPARPGAAAAWDPTWWALMIAMWWVMMIAMMVPSAAPMVLLYARVHRHSQRRGQLDRGTVPAAAFLAGYLLAWLVFSLAVTVLQWWLEQRELLHAMMMWSTHRGLSAGFLLAAGAYQLSPLKTVCLTHCRSPAAWLTAHWRDTAPGAMAMGLRHGLYCVGCCWILMLLLFAGGIMNLVWIVGLALLVLIEKLAPRGDRVARLSGIALLGGGLALLIT